ncbi:MAG: HIRAN domain-containing protein [Lachnospiraceae bacterium]|nr:HIRAN domain-containing protein [Lachnospiraceae bacterium]
MKNVYFTITGLDYRYGGDFLKKGMKVKLKKEPDNKYDREAIQVKLDGLDVIGYVANSTKTVMGESMSAGRIYNMFGKKAKGKVVLVTPRGVICKLNIKGKGRKKKAAKAVDAAEE